MNQADQEFMKEKPYRSIVGSLNYLACGTRPDIAFAVHNLSRHLENPRRTHWIALERVLNYLESNPEYSICYSKGQSTDNNLINAYSDADHGGGIMVIVTQYLHMSSSLITALSAGHAKLKKQLPYHPQRPSMLPLVTAQEMSCGSSPYSVNLEFPSGK